MEKILEQLTIAHDEWEWEEVVSHLTPSEIGAVIDHTIQAAASPQNYDWFWSGVAVVERFAPHLLESLAAPLVAAAEQGDDTAAVAIQSLSDPNVIGSGGFVRAVRAATTNPEILKLISDWWG